MSRLTKLLTGLLAGTSLVTAMMVLPYLVADASRIDGVILGLLLACAVLVLVPRAAAGRALQELTHRVEDLEHAFDRLNARVTTATAPLAAPAPQRTNDDLAAMKAELTLLQGQIDRLTGAAAVSQAAVEPAGVVAAARHANPGAAQLGTTTPLEAEQAPDLTDADIETLLHAAVQEDLVDVFLQPIVSLPQRRHRYYEVYSRIRGPDGTHLRPDQYLAIAERQGLIGALDNILLLRCVQLIRDSERRDVNVGFFLNISANTLSDAAFMREFLDFMSLNLRLIPKIVFELGQSTIQTGGPMCGKIIEGLTKLGFGFSMDNVTSLDVDFSRAERAGLQFIKLDSTTLLSELSGSLPHAAERLLEEVRHRHIDLVAEKVENEGQVVELLEHQIDFAQGFLFGEPRLSRQGRKG
jgi:cyclic-di-GMP phosphodiesterase TipF (flagellum assembly factor)